MRTAVAFGFHTDMPSDQHPADVIERCRKIWWTLYILDSHMSALMGAPRTIGERDISAQLPDYNGATQRSHALHVHIKLANIEGLIQQSKPSIQYRRVYAKCSKLCIVKKGVQARTS
jgi:proline utilization trans-activator